MRRLVLLFASVAFVAACGSSASPSAPASAVPASASAMPSGSGSQIVGPVILDETQSGATVKVGRMVVFSLENPETWKMAADPAGLVTLVPGTNDGSMMTNPGVETLAVGTVSVTLTNPAGTSHVFVINIEY